MTSAATETSPLYLATVWLANEAEKQGLEIATIGDDDEQETVSGCEAHGWTVYGTTIRVYVPGCEPDFMGLRRTKTVRFDVDVMTDGDCDFAAPVDFIL